MDPVSSDVNFSATSARLAGDGEDGAAADMGAQADGGEMQASASMPASRAMWGMGALIAALAIVSFVLVLILWFDVAHLKKQIRELVCTSLPNCVSKSDHKGIAAFAGVDTIGGWSLNLTAVNLLTGATNVPLLFTVATPQGVTLVQDSQTGASSAVAMPFDGCVKAMELAIGALPTTGSATVTLMVNGIASSFTAQFVAGMTSTVATFKPSCPVKFAAGQTLALAVTYPVGTVIPGGLQLNAGIVVQYKAASRC